MDEVYPKPTLDLSQPQSGDNLARTADSFEFEILAASFFDGERASALKPELAFHHGRQHRGKGVWWHGK